MFPRSTQPRSDARAPRRLLAGVLLAGAAAGGLTGCSQMTVTKVGAHRHAADRDGDIKGFRYYLARPYVAVMRPVVVSEEVSLVSVADPCDVSALEGTFANVSRPTSDGRWTSVTGEELAEIRGLLRDAMEIRAKGAANEDANVVRQAGYHVPRRTAATMPVDVSVEIEQPTLAAQLGDRAVADAYRNAAPAYNEYGNSGTTVGGALGMDVGDGEGITIPTTAATGLSNDPLDDAIRILYLPDLEEQYAVHHRNLFSSGAYSLDLKDGWQLNSVNGSFDSTEIPLEIIKVVETAIKAAGTVSTTAIQNPVPPIPAAFDAYGAPAVTAGKDGAKETKFLLFEVKRETVLRPGMYRINKPWEMNGPQAEGCGLLQQLGLPTTMTTTVKPFVP